MRSEAETYDIVINAISEKEMEDTIIDILIDNGMDESTALDTVLCMSTNDMEEYYRG